MQSQLSFRSMSALFVLALAMIGVVAFGAQQGTGTGAAGTCQGELWNGTIRTANCPTDCGKPRDGSMTCVDNWGTHCQCSGAFDPITTTCIRVCNKSGQVIDIQCVCFCLEDERYPDGLPPEPNCSKTKVPSSI